MQVDFKVRNINTSESFLEENKMGEENYLVPVDEYLKAGVHIGTKFKTESMKPFIYKVRPDGLAVLNVQMINDQIDVAARFLGRYAPEDILIVCRRENGWSAVKKFSELTGIKSFPGRYPPGIMTNVKLDNFIETKLLLTVDLFPDRNAIRDALSVGVPVISFCDTNNKIKDIEVVIPCNNKGKKSLGLVFWILSREYLKYRGVIKSNEEFTAKIDDFSPE